MSAVKQQNYNLLHITDSHLFKERNQDLLGIKTYFSYTAVIEAIKNSNYPFAKIVATGDLSQDQSIESYTTFFNEIKAFNRPCHWIPGNHDDLVNMQQGLNFEQCIATKSVFLNDTWQLLMLNSQVCGKPNGNLDKEQLLFLQSELEKLNNKAILIALHHNSLAVGSAWLDQHMLHNSVEFWKILKDFPQVKGVICGHVHQELDTYYQGVRVMATPATCFQFMPNSDGFALDNLSPGWREIVLTADGLIKSKVKRLPVSKFIPHLESKGY